MNPTHTSHRGRLYRYYVTNSVIKLGPETCPIRWVPAGEIEAAVIGQIRGMLRTPEVIARIWAAASDSGASVSEAHVREALIQFDPLWEELFPAEQARIVRLLVERVDVKVDGAAIKLWASGLSGLIAELQGATSPKERAERDLTKPDRAA